MFLVRMMHPAVVHWAVQHFELVEISMSPMALWFVSSSSVKTFTFKDSLYIQRLRPDVYLLEELAHHESPIFLTQNRTYIRAGSIRT